MEIHTRYAKSTLWVDGYGRDRKWCRNDNCKTTPWMPSAASGVWASTKKQAQENFKEWRAYIKRILD